MAILAWPSVGEAHSICIICEKVLPFHEATSVCEYLDGRVALACEVHRGNKVSWVEGATSFEWRCQTADMSLVPLELKNVDLYIESRQVGEPTSTKLDVGWHILTRSIAGKSIIITNHPIEFLSILRKHWKKMTRQLHIERARTLDTAKIASLDAALNRLHNLSFSGSSTRLDADVLVLSANDLARLRCTITTAYVCDALTDTQRLAAAKIIKRGGVMVDYYP